MYAMKGPSPGGHSLLYSCIHMRLGSIYWGAIFLAEKRLYGTVYFKINVMFVF